MDWLFDYSQTFFCRAIRDYRWPHKIIWSPVKRICWQLCTLYPAKHVTPYMHCMMHHVAEFMILHGSILPFTQQGLEKYNDIMTNDYFRSTSHRGEQCLVQILQKRYRIEHLESLGAKRKKQHEVRCSNCHQKDHNTHGELQVSLLWSFWWQLLHLTSCCFFLLAPRLSRCSIRFLFCSIWTKHCSPLWEVDLK